MSTKLHLVCDALGLPLCVELTGGQRHDVIGWEQLGVARLAVSSEAVLADRGDDADWIRAELRAIGASAVIPSSRSRAVPIPHDASLYRARHAIENTIGKLKEFRRIATRYEKLGANYLALIHLACVILWLR